MEIGRDKYSHVEVVTNEDEEAQADVDIWRYVLGFAETAVVKCAIDLGIADAIDRHGSPITLPQLSSAVNCSPSSLYRVMRFLTHRGIFKQGEASTYAQTPLSRRLMTGNGAKSMAAFVMLETSKVMLLPWLSLSAHVRDNNVSAFEVANGEEIWRYAMANPAHTKLINEAMADSARVTIPVIINSCPEVFAGITSLVDVGGGNGNLSTILAKSCPWIGCINFDLPHVVSAAPEVDGVKHIGGDMFDGVPKADAAILMWVLHDWNDEECVKILKKCREAIPDKKGKVIIVEAVIDEENNHVNKFKDVGLLLDMVMMAHTNTGKERTLKEWAFVLTESGFSRHTFKAIHAVQAVIEAYP